MKKYGLTGGVACGKTTFCKMLEVIGWKIIDTDAITHELYIPGAAGHQKIVDAFGDDILNSDQTVNRTLLGQLVFSDFSKRQLLNSLIHPLVREVWQQQYSEHLLRNADQPALVEIPLLFESGMESWFDSVACVACSGELQRQRLAAQGRQQIEQRLAAQWPLEKKMEQSNVVIWNNGSLEHLSAQARLLDSLWNRRA
ncbi:MAG: dephospho-CoA kinase [Verrucomicrobiota bacterium]